MFKLIRSFWDHPLVQEIVMNLAILVLIVLLPVP